MTPVADQIFFDEQDASLFLVDDARLRADALKHSLVPRLRRVMNAAIAGIRDIYGIEVLDDSIISVYPNFREKRKNELALVYDSAFVGLGGQRKQRWPGFSRKDGKPVQILPFRYAFILTQEGINILLENGWLKGLTPASYGALLQFHIEHEHKINPLCFFAQIKPDFLCEDGLPLLSPLRTQYKYRVKHGLYDNYFIGQQYAFPISHEQLSELVYAFVCFFPVYDAYLQIAKNAPSRLDTLIDKLNCSLQNGADVATCEEPSASGAKDAIALAVQAAASTIRVMPALRWQVFQRDGWKCVACGRSSQDEVILQVDHILPRSRGGPDSLDNLQTLCTVCNQGKSNRDNTDLRGIGKKRR